MRQVDIPHLRVVRLQDSCSISQRDKNDSGTGRTFQALEGNYQQDRVWVSHYPEDRSVPWDKHPHKAGRQVKAQWTLRNKNAL